MLVDLVVVLVTNDCGLVLSVGLDEVILLLVKKSDLDEGIALSLQSESVGQDRVLEVANGLLDLVSLGEDHSELVEDLTLLVEVRRHLQDSNQRTDGVIVRLELLVEDADAVPKLGDPRRRCRC